MGAAVKKLKPLKWGVLLGTGLWTGPFSSAHFCASLFQKVNPHESLVGIVETNHTLAEQLPAAELNLAQKYLDQLVATWDKQQKPSPLVERFAKSFKGIRWGLKSMLRRGLSKELLASHRKHYEHLLAKQVAERKKIGDGKKPVIFVEFDTETTGFQREASAERRADVLTEIAAQAYTVDFKKLEHSPRSRTLKDVATRFEGWAKLEDDFILPKYKVAKAMQSLRETRVGISEARLFAAIHKAYVVNPNLNSRVLAEELHASLKLKVGKGTKTFEKFSAVVAEVVEAYRYSFVFHLTAFHQVSDVKRNLTEAQLLKQFDDYLKALDEHYNVILVAHNYRFDYGMIKAAAARSGMRSNYVIDNPHWIDVMVVAKQALDMYQLLRFSYEVALYEATPTYSRDELMSKSQLNKLLAVLPFRYHNTRELAHLFGIKTAGHHQAVVDIAITAQVHAHLYALEAKLQEFIDTKAKGNAAQRTALDKALAFVRDVQIRSATVDGVQVMTTSFRAPYYEQHRSELKRLLSINEQGREVDPGLRLPEELRSYIFDQTPSSGVIYDAQLPESPLMEQKIDL